MNDVTIRIDGLWKRYGLPVPAVMRKGINWFHAIRNPQSAIRNTDDGPWALRDINLQVKRGETLGIIGRNGAGKSTLLKVLAGVIPPTRGRVEVRGRVFPMIELNAGLHMELTARENVRLLGAIMGLSREDIEDRIPEIEEFCELGEWFNRPVRKYSSGMVARLGFGVAVNVNADILLVDEVLAVGDLAFQRKCYVHFEKLRKAGTTTLFVSHNMRQVERMCDRVMFLAEGKTLKEGDPDEVCLLYYKMSSREEIRSVEAVLPIKAVCETSGEFQIEEVQIFDKTGNPAHAFKTLDPMRIRVKYYATEKINNPVVGIVILTSDVIRVSAFGTGHDYREDISLKGESYFEVSIPMVHLLPGVYSVAVNVKSSNGRRIYSGQNLAQFAIEYSSINKDHRGLIHIEADWVFANGQLLTKPR